jgi:HPt (histidine-containing phosphotransfer) domain-containing protein
MPDAPLDRATVEGLHELGAMSADGPDRIRQLVATFIADAVSRADRLASAVAGGDAPEVRSLAHSLAGSSANLGAHVVATASRELEAQGRAGDLAASGAAVERLRSALDAAIAALRLEFGLSEDDDHSH